MSLEQYSDKDLQAELHRRELKRNAARETWLQSELLGPLREAHAKRYSYYGFNRFMQNVQSWDPDCPHSIRHPQLAEVWPHPPSSLIWASGSRPRGRLDLTTATGVAFAAQVLDTDEGYYAFDDHINPPLLRDTWNQNAGAVRGAADGSPSGRMGALTATGWRTPRKSYEALMRANSTLGATRAITPTPWIERTDAAYLRVPQSRHHHGCRDFRD